MSIRSYCRIPNITSKAPEGSNPDLFFDLKSELEDADSINLSLCLFTNPLLKDFLIEEADKGCEINIITLPLFGYKNKNKKLVGYPDGISARELAKINYNLINEHENISLYLFPHVYSWFGPSYSGGNPPYSFHIKSAEAEFEGVMKSLLFSGNLSFGDKPFSENMIVFENIPEYNNSFHKFFIDIIEHSISYDKYTRISDGTILFDFRYQGNNNIIYLVPQNFSKSFFTAPFYNIGGFGSNHYASRKIIDLINNSTNRIYICGQHVHDVGSYDAHATTIFSAIKNIFNNNPDVDIRMLKQCDHKGLSDKSRSAITECFFNFYLDKPMKKFGMIHDKFIIIDDKLLVSTANFTPTQFAFGNCDMKIKIGENTFRKIDIFSEVNGFVIVEVEDIVHNYTNHFNELWALAQDIEIII
jgi:hypothetical protein